MGKIGTKLQEIRKEYGINQAEMANFFVKIGRAHV